MEPLEQLINELNDMVRFVNENSEVVNKVLEEELNNKAGVKKASEEDVNAKDKALFEPDALKNSTLFRQKRELTIMMEK